MSLKSISTDILTQLAEVINQLSDTDYAHPLPVLSGNTIGKHVRHIVEFYELLVRANQTQQLNYDHRQRDLRLEVDTHLALEHIQCINEAVRLLNLAQTLQLTTDLSQERTGERIQIPSSMGRELLYNIEHAIHHMALVQVAIQNSFPVVALPPHFGVAFSTVQHQSR